MSSKATKQTRADLCLEDKLKTSTFPSLVSLIEEMQKKMNK